MGRIDRPIASITPAELTERARAVARASLDPAVPAVPRSAAIAFAEQMVVDVASMTTDIRAAGLAELGAGAPAFVLALWTEDMMIRASAACREMFGEEWRDPDFCGDRCLGGPREISPRGGQAAGPRSGDLRTGQAPRGESPRLPALPVPQERECHRSRRSE